MLGIIAKRRDGQLHSEDELRFVAASAASGSIPDYQLSAWLMAAYLNPLSEQETAWLTVAMAESGERIDLTGLPKPWVDKHSTGGVGDKTTLVLLPLLAACGLTVVKMSGRGLGITGGTVDKLGSVPGFRMDLSPEEMKEQAAQIGLAITGQTPSLAPADKALYALRDATGTVESIPLIASSILSKKIAGGAEAVVFDVKCGSGAFMSDLEQASELAGWLTRIGTLSGLRVATRITDMEQPLGTAVGNALEVAEAIQVLRGDPLSPPVARFRELCVKFAGIALGLAGLDNGEERAEQALTSGAALAKAREWFEAQGANPGVFDEPWAHLPQATKQSVVEAEGDGWIASMDARTIGQACIELGGGRKRKEDTIDPSVGLSVHAMVGDKVAKGQPLVTVHAASESSNLLPMVRSAIRIKKEAVPPRPLFLD